MDCKWWKEYGMMCTYTYKHTGDLVKACRHFKLRKDGQDTNDPRRD